jgi:DNA (cytosine-5)-methyltransferase 1
LRTIAFSEIESFACANLVSKMEAGLLDAAPIWTDLKTFPWDQFRGKVDILSGGFPCQPFSCAGKRDGDEDPRHLFPYILDGIGRCRPSVVFLENVEGILSAKLNGDNWRDPAGTPVLLHVLRELERVGYKATAGIFSASEVGAPHQRKRVFIMSHSHSGGMSGSRNELGNAGETRQRGTHTSQDGIIQNVWPSRPGQPQFSWEPPRVVENPKTWGGGVLDDTQNSNDQRWQSKVGERGANIRGDYQVDTITQQHRGTDCSPREYTQCETEPSMGGNPNGATRGLGHAELYLSCDNRTDELKLLGNGVVPATAELAFRTLKTKLQLQ